MTIPAPPSPSPSWTLREKLLLKDAELYRAAQIVEALQQHGKVRVTAEAFEFWPSLRLLDLTVIGNAVGHPVEWVVDPAAPADALLAVRVRE